MLSDLMSYTARVLHSDGPLVFRHWMLKLFKDMNDFRLIMLNRYYSGDTEAWVSWKIFL